MPRADIAVELLSCTPDAERLIEKAGREAYGSAASPTLDGAREWIGKRLSGWEHDVLEHAVATFRSKAAQINVVAAHIARYNTGRIGQEPDRPLNTVVGDKHFGVVTSNLVKLYGTNNGASVEDPLPTVTATGQHLGEVRAFLAAYYGSERDGQALTEPLRTVPTRDRFGLVTVHGQAFEIVDIGMRMLEPKELFAAQGFPSEYIISPLVSVVRREDGTFSARKKPVPMPDTEQIRMAGNAVCPDVARALVAANVQFDRQPEMWRGYELAGTHRGIREMEAAR